MYCRCTIAAFFCTASELMYSCEGVEMKQPHTMASTGKVKASVRKVTGTPRRRISTTISGPSTTVERPKEQTEMPVAKPRRCGNQRWMQLSAAE